MVIANAENYIVANGVFFRLIQQKKVFDTSIKCLLTVLEKFENSVFHMFHDTLLGAHVSTYTTLSKIIIGYIICLKNYKDTYPHVRHVNNKNRKEVRFLIVIQGFH